MVACLFNSSTRFIAIFPSYLGHGVVFQLYGNNLPRLMLFIVVPVLERSVCCCSSDSLTAPVALHIFTQSTVSLSTSSVADDSASRRSFDTIIHSSVAVDRIVVDPLATLLYRRWRSSLLSP
jgi:hypothetical protein